jgi:hypothetical protein
MITLGKKNALIYFLLTQMRCRNLDAAAANASVDDQQ